VAAPDWVAARSALQRLAKEGDQLVVHERTPSGRARTYLDPHTGQTFTQYAVQKAKAHGLTPAQAAQVRRSSPRAFAVLERAHKRHEHVDQLLERAALLTGRSKRQLLESGEFVRRVKDLAIRGRRPSSRKAAALEFFGYRPAGAPFDVGESDDVLGPGLDNPLDAES
jgi:hypothetical protein